MRSGGVFQKLTAILQQATAEKRDSDGMFFSSPEPKAHR